MPISKNNQNTLNPRFGSTPKTGIELLEMGILIVLFLAPLPPSSMPLA